MRKHSAVSVCDFRKTRGLSERRLSATVHSRSSPAETCTPPNQRSRVKKKASKTSAYRRDIQGGETPSETRRSVFTCSHIQEVFVKETLPFLFLFLLKTTVDCRAGGRSSYLYISHVWSLCVDLCVIRKHLWRLRISELRNDARTGRGLSGHILNRKHALGSL